MISIMFSITFTAFVCFAGESSPTEHHSSNHGHHGHSNPETSPQERQAVKKSGVIGYDLYVSGSSAHVISAIRYENTEYLSYKNTSDYGKTWSLDSKIEFTKNKIYSSARGAYPQIVVSKDLVLVIWNMPGNTRFGSGHLATAFSKDGGKTWSAAKTPSDSEKSEGENFADLFATEDGRIGAVWLDSRNKKQGLRLSFFEPIEGLWGKNIDLDSETCQCCWNKAVAIKNSSALVLYRDMSPRDMAVASYNLQTNKVNFAIPVFNFNWDFNACPHKGGGLDYYADKNLNITVTTFWNGNPTAAQYFSQSRDDGKSWTKPLKIEKEGLEHGDVAINNKSIGMVFFNSEDGQIYYSKSSHYKINQKFKKINVSNNYQKSPQIVSLKKKFLVMWIEEAGQYELKNATFE